MSWETVIGLETHVQLSTKTKLFSRASTAFGASPNTNVNLIDCGLPGVLPSVNKEAFYKAIRFGMAIDAQINQTSLFDRKNYFYADLPKGYQITQMDWLRTYQPVKFSHIHRHSPTRTNRGISFSWSCLPR